MHRFPLAAVSAAVVGTLMVAAAGCDAAPAQPGLAPGGSSSGASAPGSPTGGSSTSVSPTTSSSTSSSTSPSTGSPSAGRTAAPVELPRGGTTLFPRYRLVGYVGYPGSPALGRLGTGDLDDRVDEIESRAKSYRDGREIMPVLELITVVVQGSPGRDGDYRSRISDSVIKRYLAAARRHRALLLLDVQPGRSDFLTEVKALEPWLTEPDVGLALDPEWAMGPGQVPGRMYGSTTGTELDAVGRYVSRLVTKNGLPQKPIVYHQVARSVVKGESAMRERDGVVWIKSVDGIGSAGSKESTYNLVNRSTPGFVHAGFKVFFSEDREHGALMTPSQVLGLRPKPEYVMYE